MTGSRRKSYLFMLNGAPVSKKQTTVALLSAMLHKKLISELKFESSEAMVLYEDSHLHGK